MSLCITCNDNYVVDRLIECDNCDELVCDDCIVELNDLLFCSETCEQEL
jgi:hypothetical protein